MLFGINNYWMVTLVNVSHSMKLFDCEKLDKWKLSDRTIDIVPVARIGIWNNMTINKSTRDGFKHLDIMLYLSNGLGVARLVLPFKASLDETTWNTVEVNFYFLTRHGWKAKISQKSLIPPFLFINKIKFNNIIS